MGQSNSYFDKLFESVVKSNEDINKRKLDIQSSNRDAQDELARAQAGYYGSKNATDLAQQQMQADTTKYGADTTAQTAANRLAAERPQYEARSNLDNAQAQGINLENTYGSSIFDSKLGEQQSRLAYNKNWYDSSNNKPEAPAFKSDIALPNAEPTWSQVDQRISAEANKWKPTGYGMIDWTARRARNIAKAPYRVGEAISSADFWNY